LEKIDLNEVQKPYLQTNDIGGNQKRQSLDMRV